MQNQREILETVRMIEQQHLDIRTITMGISLYDCADADPKAACRKIYDKVTRMAGRLVRTGEAIETEYGIPIVNKRVAVTPVAEVAAASATVDYVPFAEALDRAAETLGVNFIGGFSALVQKGMTEADRRLISGIPEALAVTERVCSSVNVASTRAGINMDAVAWMGRIIKATARRTEARGGFGCAKLVVFANAVEDNPFMAGAFHGAGEPECCINVGVSGPGVVKKAIDRALAENPRVLLAIEGGAASGKSTLADLLTAIYPDTALFHADDFFLRPEQRTAARYAQPGGNLDRERLESEILIPISRNKAAVYRPFNCRTLSLREPVTILPGRLNIVEGSYSFHPELARYYDLSVFLDISPETQRSRILKRNGPEWGQQFFDRWIPLERRYFDALDVRNRYDLVLSADD